MFPKPTQARRGVPIVPMIDILFIILIYLIATTTFKKRRDVLSLELPTVKELPTKGVIEERTVLAVNAAGEVSLDGLQVPSPELLEGYLVSFQKNYPGRKLELEADRALPLEKLIVIWDALTRAGIPVKEVPARIRLPQDPVDSSR